MYETVLWDLDGTLTDSGPGIFNSVRYALSKFGIEEPDDQPLRRFIGPPLIHSFMTFYGFSETDAMKAVGYYREYYPVNGIFENSLYDGIGEILAGLKNKGIKNVLATSKPETFAVRILDYFNISQYFDEVIGATMDGKISEKPDVIAYALERAHVSDKSKVIMIGDRDYDTKGASINGIDSIGILYGYGCRQEHEDAGATFICETTRDLMDFFAL